MTDREFWEVIAAIEWTVPPEWHLIREHLVGKLHPVQAEGLWWTFRFKLRELDLVVASWEQESGNLLALGEDDRDDVLAFIVGLGEADYTAACAMPELVAARAKRADFVPGFLKAIPSASDYDRKAT